MYRKELEATNSYLAKTFYETVTPEPDFPEVLLFKKLWSPVKNKDQMEIEKMQRRQ